LQVIGDSGNPAILDGRHLTHFLTTYTDGSLVNRAHLVRLCGKFNPGAVVVLQGCHVANGERGRVLLQALSRLWNVPILGGTTLQYHPMGDTVDPLEGGVVLAYGRVIGKVNPN
jgi:hypothetical protein